MRLMWLGAVCVGVCLPASAALGAEPPGGAPATTSAPAAPATSPDQPAEEPPITVPGPEGDYLRKIHRDIHFRWAHRFIASVEARPAKDPINNPALAAEVYFTIRWDGSPAEVTLGTSSGNKELDRAAVAAVRGEGTKFAVPPVALYGDDGVVHLRWTLARDHRRCSDGELRRVEDPLDVALPRLFIQGRYKEALLRVNRYMERGDTGAMAVFARTWLARPLTNRVADLDAAAALARIGDRRQLDRLRPGLASADTVVVAARGLAALKVDLCAELDPALRARGPQADVAMTALREAGAAAPGAPCLATLTAIVDDEAAPKPLRAKALRTLASLDYASARKRTIELLADPSPVLRAAAATAFARPGGGRPSLYRLEPMLKDGNVEVRAAVAGALVRASGELSFDYLQALFKSPDNRPLLAMIPALGELSSPASADLLAKILKRGPEVQEPVLRALAVRTDEKAVAAFKPLAASAKRSSRTSNDLRLFLYATSPVDEVMPLAKDPHLGILAYKAMLRAKRHKEAAEWLVGRFDHLSPEVLSDALGAWLAEPPKPFASAH